MPNKVVPIAKHSRILFGLQTQIKKLFNRKKKLHSLLSPAWKRNQIVQTSSKGAWNVCEKNKFKAKSNSQFGSKAVSPLIWVSVKFGGFLCRDTWNGKNRSETSLIASTINLIYFSSSQDSFSDDLEETREMRKLFLWKLFNGFALLTEAKVLAVT